MQMYDLFQFFKMPIPLFPIFSPLGFSRTTRWPNPLRTLIWIALFFSFFFFLGCATDLYWAKPDAVQGEFEQDLRSCRETLIDEVQYSETSLNPLSRGITDEALAKCLNSKGWFLAEKP